VFCSRLTRTAAIVVAVTAIGASSAAAQPADVRSPDAVDAGQAAVVQPTAGDIRTPDAKDAGQPITTTSSGIDVRTPDARDYGDGRGTFSAPEVTVVKVVGPSPAGGGFDWADAGIGAGGLLGIALLALGGTLIVTHHRHSTLRIG
jgi:hypothetical protein